jgi:polyisoprenoid-binding protein YceI
LGTLGYPWGVLAAISVRAQSYWQMFAGMRKGKTMNSRYMGLLSFMAAAILLPALSVAQVPVFEVTPGTSTIKFNVQASVAIAGNFKKWDATLKFTTPEVSTGALDIEIQADTVSTGSGMKDRKLKGEDFFDAQQNPLITFKSTKVVQTGPTTFDVPGTFTIRGVSKPETLKLSVTGKGTGSGTITGTMAFDRKEYGMNSGIPFIKIADRVEVDIDLHAKRISGPPVVMK